MTATIAEPGLYEMTNAEYHSQPALSASGMKTLLEAPAKFKYQREHPVFKDVYDFGSAWHKAILGDAGEVLVVVDADSWRTKDAQAIKAQARAEGKIPILAKDGLLVTAMVNAFRQNREAMEILDLEHGSIEHSAFWEDPRTGLQLRVRFDYLPDGSANGPFTIADPKTAKSSDPYQWLRSAPDYGYHIQESLYRQAVRDLGLHPRPQFAFLIQEKEPPYIVSVVRLDPEAQAIGDYLVRQAIDTFTACTESDQWGGYVDDVHVGALPQYYVNRFEGLI